MSNGVKMRRMEVETPEGIKFTLVYWFKARRLLGFNTVSTNINVREKRMKKRKPAQKGEGK